MKRTQLQRIKKISKLLKKKQYELKRRRVLIRKQDESNKERKQDKKNR